jgi:dihydroorotase
MNYDIVLRNAHVIDPSQGLSKVLDIGVCDGLIAGLGPLEVSPSAVEYDPGGKYLCPGLVDLHGHWYEGSLFGIDPNVCLNHGVTTVVDAGTSGFVNYHEFRRHCIDEARIRVLAFLNIGAVGIPTPFAGELQDLRYAKPREAAELLACETSTLLGVKIRLGANTTGDNGREALERALQAATPSGLPIMVHISKGADTPRVLGKLRPRDILTHCFQGRGDGLFPSNQVIPEALEARARGVVFDVGHGCGSFSWDTARKAFELHFYPDTISTDLHRFSVERYCMDMPTTMSKFLRLGMSLEDVILKTTWAPAMAIGKEKEIGTLRPGAAADMFVFDFEEGEFPLEDTHLKVVIANQMLRPHLTLKAGQPIEPGSIRACMRRLHACDLEVFKHIEETA